MVYTDDALSHSNPFIGSSMALESVITKSQSVTSGLRIEVFCDGACSGNPGPGGFGVLVRIPRLPDITRASGYKHTTNNQMEMLGAIAGIEIALENRPSEIIVTTDSQYVVKGMTSWLPNWKRKGWRTATGNPVKNRELWEQLDKICGQCKVTWHWIKGHAGHAENERCDQMASKAIQDMGTNRSSW